MAFNWQLLVNIAETGANVAEMALAPELLPLTQAGEAALNPLLAKISAGETVGIADVMAFYGTEIAALNLIKSKTTDPTLITRVEEYLSAANTGATDYLLGAAGLSPSEFIPVTPIVLPPH